MGTQLSRSRPLHSKKKEAKNIPGVPPHPLARMAQEDPEAIGCCESESLVSRLRSDGLNSQDFDISGREEFRYR
jgi:hypothetical protein